MNILQTLVNLCFRIVLASSSSWFEDFDGANRLYSPSLMAINVSSLLTCTVRFSSTAKCQAMSHNNGTGVCTCLGKKKSMGTRSGNRLWQRKFDGFNYIAQLDWYIRLVFDTNKTYAEAESFCGSIGAGLAVVDTDEKLNYLTGMLGFPRNTSNWHPGEPNNYFPTEDCVAIYNSGFNDYPCEEKWNFVCDLD